jgi:hypothetical protein
MSAAIAAKTGKPKWAFGGVRHPLFRLSRGTFGGMADVEQSLAGVREADAIDRDVERAIAAGALPAKLATRLKKVARVLRQWELVRVELRELDEEVFGLLVPVLLTALQRARASGKYDAEDLDETECCYRGDVTLDQVRAEHAEK